MGSMSEGWPGFFLDNIEEHSGFLCPLYFKGILVAPINDRMITFARGNEGVLCEVGGTGWVKVSGSEDFLIVNVSETSDLDVVVLPVGEEPEDKAHREVAQGDFATHVNRGDVVWVRVGREFDD